MSQNQPIDTTDSDQGEWTSPVGVRPERDPRGRPVDEGAAAGTSGFADEGAAAGTSGFADESAGTPTDERGLAGGRGADQFRTAGRERVADPATAERDADTADQRSGLVGDPGQLRTRWEAVQIGFVDDPRRSVEEADQLVLKAAEAIVDAFQQERSRLEKVWSAGDEVSTEDLRRALQRYRDFFERFLSV